MKTLKKRFLVVPLSIIALSLAACSSTSTDKPAADTPTAAGGTGGTGGNGSTAPAEAPKPAPAPAPKLVTVPAGTTLDVVLVTALASDKSNAGDKFEANLAAPVAVDGTEVLGKGTKVHGQVIDAKGSGRVKGLASITLALTDVVQDGNVVPIATKNWGMEAQSTKKKDAGIIGGAAAIGTAIGAIAGGKKGAVEGAAVGGGAGVGGVLVTKGKEVELGPEARIKFTLDKSVDLAAR